MKKSLIELFEWIQKTIKLHSSAFLWIISTVYFMQGFRSYTTTATTFLLKDLHYLPSETMIVKSISKQPWNYKFIYGLLSDHFPIYKKHVKYYFLCCTIFICVGYFSLGLIPSPKDAPVINSTNSTTSQSVNEGNTTNNNMTLVYTTLFLFLIQFGGAFADVLIDALVIRASRQSKEGSAFLQSWCWALMAIGGIIGTLLGGLIVNYYKPQILFLGCALMPLWMFYLGIRFKEEDSDFRFDKEHFWNHFFLLWDTIKQKNVLLPIAWCWLAVAIVPSLSDGMLYFRNDIGMSAATLGWIDALAYLGLFLGTLIYAKFLTKVSFRKIFFCGQLIYCLLSLMDLVQLTRLNLKLGLPDILFTLTSDSISEVLSRCMMMPFLVLCAQLCPPTIEATFFALLMSISNSSMDVSGFFGAFLMHVYQVKEHEYNGLFYCVLWRSFLCLVPCLLINWVPNVHSLSNEEPPVDDYFQLNEIMEEHLDVSSVHSFDSQASVYKRELKHIERE